MDPMRVRFLGKLITASHDKGGSIESGESEAFVDGLFAEWVSLGQPLDACSIWLSTRLEHCFISLGDAPRWVEDEPTWAFHRGMPMIFISQTTFPDDVLCAEKLSVGETAYLFAIREQGPRGARMVYRVVSQFEADRAEP